MVNRDRAVLLKICEEIEYLKSQIQTIELDKFMSNEMMKRATAMTLINIGELANHLSKEFKKINDQIPFHKVVALRNVAAHGYHSLKFESIWKTAIHDIPNLELQIKQILDKA